MPRPEVIATHASDGAFARNWLDGPHPLLLQRARDPAELRARIAIDDASWARALPDRPSLAALLDSGRLFFVDYELLQHASLHGDRVGRDSRWRD